MITFLWEEEHEVEGWMADDGTNNQSKKSYVPACHVEVFVFTRAHVLLLKD